METILYPVAVRRQLADHSSPGKLEDRNLIVLHSTEGPTAEGAMATFATSVAPHRVSAHFVVDRDGTVYQLLGLNETAWHASQCNAHSIGIEHAAISEWGAEQLNRRHALAISEGKQRPFEYMPATDQQYAASAKLVAWLCGQMGIQCNRNHVRTHNEASPADLHVQCCTGALDADRVVREAVAVLAKR